jgi:chromate transport protein ChrA
LFTLFPLVACLAGRVFCWPTVIFLVALFLVYQRAGKYHHFSALQMVTFPVASVLLLYAMLRSMVLALWRGGITWRGTFYSLGELREWAGR